MKPLLPLVFIALFLTCRPKSPALVQPDPPNPPAGSPQSVGTVVAGSGDRPAILEAMIEGVGKAVIDGRTIRVRLPVEYTKTTIRLDYKVTEGVKLVEPASGSELAIRAFPVRPICIQKDAYGNCTLAYQLVIETPSRLTVTPDPATLQLELNQFYQPYEFVFTLGNLKTAPSGTRNFQIRLVNQATGYSYTGDNYLVYDLAGQPVFVNDLNAPPLPNEGKLRLTGTLPLGMSAGTYSVTIQVPTCYSPDSDGRCFSFGYEYVDLPTPLLIQPGPPLIGFANPSASANRELLITGRNFLPTKRVTVQLTSDFTVPLTTPATIQNDTLARLLLPAGQPTGQYQLDILPEDGKPSRALFTIPTQKASASFAYVAPLGQFAANRNWFPTLPVFKRGETLEMRYTFTTGATSYTESVKRTVKQVRLVNSVNARLVYELSSGGAFTPFALATDFYLWKWSIPNAVPAGTYALIFEDFDGTPSLPYYQKVRVE